VEASLKEIVREEISSIIVNTGNYTVLERQLINKVLEENKFQQGGLVDESQISEIGRRMGANYVFVTTISPLGSNFYISCKMTEVLTARIEMQHTAQTKKGVNDIVETVQNLVNTMFGIETPVQHQQTSSKLFGSIFSKRKKNADKPVATVQDDVIDVTKTASNRSKATIALNAGDALVPTERMSFCAADV
jgi:hypothetical protein